MMQKFGITSTRAKKECPVAKDAKQRASKMVTCECGRKYIKECPTEDLCAVSVLTCPHCGAKIN